MERTLKAGLAGLGLLISLWIVCFIFRVFWFLALLMLPWFLLALALYFVGYAAPNLGRAGIKLHKRAEGKIRSVLDWLDFHAPVWSWQMITGVRRFLDWLGLHVS